METLAKIKRLPDNPWVITGKLSGAHLATDPVKAAADRVSQEIAESMGAE